MDNYQGKNLQQHKSAQPKRKLRGISGSTLKWIAVVTMVVDHFAAGILGRYLTSSGADFSGDSEAINQWISQNEQLFSIYSIMRMIGRLAFPIYCFLLVEGFSHTKNRMKYASRLFVFAVVSEIPFDLLFKARLLETSYQNVFFTLFLGLLALIGLEWVQERRDLNLPLRILLNLSVIVGCMGLAGILKTDYAEMGVACILILYLTRKKKGYQILAGCIAFSWEMTAPLAFLPIALYNGKRGWNLKYFFYLVYPVHLLLLYLACAALGISSFAPVT